MTQPKLLTTAWGENGLRNNIPHNRTDDMAQENATYADGFPSVTMTPISLGGKPPSGKDMNGVLHELSAHIVYQNKGQRYRFDAAYCQAIGGYPKGAVLMNDRADTEYISLVDKNTANFNVATVNITGKWAVLNNATQLANKASKDTAFTAGSGLTGGGTLAENRTFTLGTPSKITASTTNLVTATSHTHEIDKATPTVAGVVKLVNVLNSTATDAALSAAQGKALAEQIALLASGGFALRGTLGSRNLNDVIGAENYGVWDNSANANATSERNYPILKAGTLFVLPSAYKGQQVYIPFDDKGIWIRDTRSNAATPTWGDWYKLAVPENVLTSTSTTSPLSAAMGKKLNDEKLGNSGTQTLAGVLNINMPNQWAAMHFQTKSGYWRFETNPAGDSASNGMRFNYVFTGADNTEKSRIAFPESVGTSTVAYQGWVSEQIQNAKPSNFGGIDLDTATTPQFFINARSANPLPVAGDWAGLVIGYSNDSTQIIAAAGNLWVRGSDNNPISDPSHWSEWRRLLDETNGVTLSGNQTINGTKTFSGSLTTQSTVRFSHSSKGVFGALGMGADDVYLHNPTSNKYLQMQDDGVLAYSNDKIMLASMLSSAVNSASTATIANSAAVKTAYDKAVAAQNSANTKANLSDFARSHAENGYQKLPNGLIMQWGKFAVNNDSYASMTFPIAFPKACFGVQAAVEANWGISGQVVLSVHVGNLTKTGCSFGVSENGVGGERPVYWFAIGN